MREMAVKRAQRFGYGERAEQVCATKPMELNSNVAAALDRSMDTRRQAVLFANSSLRKRTKSSVAGPSADGLRDRNLLRTEISGRLSSPEDRDSREADAEGELHEALQLQDETDLQRQESAEASTRTLLQELVEQNARLA